MDGEHNPSFKGDDGELDPQHFLDPDAQPPQFIEVTDGQSGDHLVLESGPPTTVILPAECLFDGDPDKLIAYGTGPNVEGLILPPKPPEENLP